MNRRLGKAALSLAVATVCASAAFAASDLQNGAPGTVGSPGVAGNPGTNGTAGGDAPPVSANATSTDAYNSATANGGRGGPGGKGGDGSPAGSPGGKGGAGGAGGAATATGSTTSTTPVTGTSGVGTIATATGGAGGTGGNGGSIGTPTAGAGGSGGNGGSAIATATTSAVQSVNVGANAIATGGAGGSPGLGNGLPTGGAGGDAHASASVSNTGNFITGASATVTGGAGGDSQGPGTAGGNGGRGIVDFVFASLNGNGIVQVQAQQTGGHGGSGGDSGGRGGDGASSFMNNVVGGSSQGGLQLSQLSFGGGGGWGAGNGGDASSLLTLTDTTAATLTVNLQAAGGHAGVSNVNFGPGNAGSATVGGTITGAHDVTINARATGGDGDNGGGSASFQQLAGISTGGGDVSVTGTLYTGAGGILVNNETLPGVPVSAINAIDGTTTGNLSLIQTVNSHTGGAATSSLSKSTDSLSLYVGTEANESGLEIGGQVSATASATNTGGAATANAGTGVIQTLGSGAASSTAQATSPFNQATASSTAIGGTQYIPAPAISQATANTRTGIALSDSSSNGGSGNAQAYANAATGLVISAQAHGSAPTQSALSHVESRDSVGQAAPAPSLASGLQAAAFLTATPTQSDSLAALAQHSIQKDFNVDGSGPGPKSDVLGLLTLSGLGSSTAANVYTADASEVINPFGFSSPQHILLGLLDASVSSNGFDSLHFQATVNGAVAVDQTFTTLADAESYFTDHTVDEGPLAAGPDGLTHLGWELDLTSTAGDGFGANFIVANATENLATPEPGAICLLGIGVLGLLRRSRAGRMRKE